MRKIFSSVIISAGCLATMIGCTTQNPVTLAPENEESVATVTNQQIATFTPASGTAAMAASILFFGNIEIVQRSGASLEHLYWYPGSTGWIRTTGFGANVTGNPAICVNYTSQNIEVLVPEGTSGQLRHYWRDNSSAQNWYTSYLVSSNCTGSPSMICNRMLPERLEAVVRQGTDLKYFWRDGNYIWQPEMLFGTSGVTGDPKLVMTDDGQMHVIAKVGNNIGYWKRVTTNQWKYMGSFTIPSGYSCTDHYTLAASPVTYLEAIVTLKKGSIRFVTYKLAAFKSNGASNFQYDGDLSGSYELSPENLGATNYASGDIHYSAHILSYYYDPYYGRVIQSTGSHSRIIQ